MLTIMIIIMLGLLMLSYPMMVPIIVAPIVIMMAYFPALPPTLLIQQMISGVRIMSLIAIPMFIFAAAIMTRGETSNRLIDIVLSFVKHVHGGLAIATNAVCTMFGAICGSTQATVVAIGQPMYPKLMEAGYSSSFSLGLIINASDIALLIPPSIGMIVYGVVSGNSVGDLFIAGIIPGVMVFLLFSAYSYFYSKHIHISLQPKASWKERIRTMKRALVCFGFPVIIIGGIYSGFFSPNEAAGASIFYAIILEVFVFKAIKIKDIPDIALETGVITAVVFILIATGKAFSWVITFARIPNQVLPVILGSDPSMIEVLLVINAAFFIGCMFVDNIVVIMVLTPIIYPTAMSVGINPIALGVMISLQAAMGSATPPLGCDIFTAMAIFRRPYLEIIRCVGPFTLIEVVVIFILIFFPQVALFLGNIAGG